MGTNWGWLDSIYIGGISAVRGPLSVDTIQNISIGRLSSAAPLSWHFIVYYELLLHLTRWLPESPRWMNPRWLSRKFWEEKRGTRCLNNCLGKFSIIFNCATTGRRSSDRALGTENITGSVLFNGTVVFKGSQPALLTSVPETKEINYRFSPTANQPSGSLSNGLELNAMVPGKGGGGGVYVQRLFCH